ncbi:winged helix-turn-helix transcriptional regulator [Candidatus Pacearchaeota archaeon]|nr:winged helix-turn-helix transcriptional regulator [Candidatus Pacearchaeota archaeon]
MHSIKEAFQRVGKDIGSIKEELTFLRKSIAETRTRMIELCEIINKLSKKTELFNQKKNIIDSTHKPKIPTTSTHPSTHNKLFNPLNPQNLSISTGNGGVSTDRQTDRQTDRHKQNKWEKSQDSINNAAEILNSLDNIKKEIRIKFKRITEQELLVFSTIYQLDEEQGHADYKLLSKKLNLTESSIRDYVQRLIKKGIPVEKKRINNKTIILNISKNLKKIASLSTILQLRGL